MKKFVVLTTLVAMAIVFSNCHGSKKTAAVPKLTYEANLKTVIETNCAPCHIAGKGNKKPYDNFANVKTDIDDMIRRIELNPEDRGFMPFKHPKLPAATIAIFKQWRADGLLER